VYFAKNAAYFPFNSWLSFQRLCRLLWGYAVVKVDRRIRWHYTTTILRLRIGARLTKYRNCKFQNFARTISRHADGISRYSVPPSAGPLLPLGICFSGGRNAIIIRSHTSHAQQDDAYCLVCLCLCVFWSRP